MNLLKKTNSNIYLNLKFNQPKYNPKLNFYNTLFRNFATTINLNKTEKKFIPKGQAVIKAQEKKNKLAKDFNPGRPFDQQDYKEQLDIQRTKTFDVRYLRIMNDWKDNLKRKHAARGRSRELLDNFVSKYTNNYTKNINKLINTLITYKTIKLTNKFI